MAEYSAQGSAVQGVSIDNNRRIFNFGERVAELAPIESPFFTYLKGVANKPTDDPVFKMLEERHQWQRRSAKIKGAIASASYTNGTQVANLGLVDSDYDVYGREVGTPVAPQFILEGQIIAVADTTGTVRNFKVSGTPDLTASGGTAAELDLTPLFSATCAFADDAAVEIVGSAFAEATGAPSAWKDELYDREGYCQIFKTAVPVFSGTALATRYRGRPDEFKRVYAKKLKEHKADIEKAMLFGLGRSDESGSGPERHTHGIVPYTEANGQVFNFTYASSAWDDFLDTTETFFSPESGNSGNKLVLASRKVLTWLNKLGTGSFLNNTVGTSQYKFDLQTIPGAFGHTVTKVDTMYGTLHFVMEPFMRGPYENYAVAVDLSNVAYRPLVGNGQNRDTVIMTNVQANDSDSRQDMILTEAGLEIALPETHAIMKFS